MLLFIIFGSMVVVGIGMLLLDAFVIHEENIMIGLGLFFLIVGFIAVIICLCCLPMVGHAERELNQKIAEVDVYMESGKQIRSMVEYNCVFDSIVEINYIIQKHKAYVESPWRGVFLSKKIAGMEPYSYDGLKDPATKFIIDKLEE